MNKTPQKIIDIFESTKGEDGRVPLSLIEFESLVFKFYLNQDSKDHKIGSGERLGMWIVIGTIFFIGLLVGSGDFPVPW
jgi:hypothetical protein